MRTFIIPVLTGLALAACDQISTEPASEIEAETPPPLEAPAEEAPVEMAETRNVAERKTAQIDWNSARRDFAARETTDTGMVSVESGGSPAVPILLPEQQFGVESTGENALQFRPMADGYFAVQKGETFDLIINGTDRLIANPNGASGGDGALKFEETMTGAQVSFSRYGASYLVEFMCKDLDQESRVGCVNEADALALVEELLIAGTR